MRGKWIVLRGTPAAAHLQDGVDEPNPRGGSEGMPEDGIHFVQRLQIGIRVVLPKPVNQSQHFSTFHFPAPHKCS
jgi:hypothetical protein